MAPVVLNYSVLTDCSGKPCWSIALLSRKWDGISHKSSSNAKHLYYDKCSLWGTKFRYDVFILVFIFWTFIILVHILMTLITMRVWWSSLRIRVINHLFCGEYHGSLLSWVAKKVNKGELNVLLYRTKCCADPKRNSRRVRGIIMFARGGGPRPTFVNSTM